MIFGSWSEEEIKGIFRKEIHKLCHNYLVRGVNYRMYG
jgi:hypothetical protein